MTAKIKDPEQKTGAIIWALEYSVFYKSTFGDKYGDKITEANFKYIEIFDTEYKTRFKKYYTKLESQTEQLKQEILKKQEELKWKQEELTNTNNELKKVLQKLEITMAKFSADDVKKNVSIKKLTIKTEAFYKEGWFPISSHLQSLFNATK